VEGIQARGPAPRRRYR